MSISDVAFGVQNLAFNSEQKVKMQIVETLGSELLFSLLSERDPGILMRTLGLLRNLLSKKVVSMRPADAVHKSNSKYLS